MDYQGSRGTNGGRGTGNRADRVENRILVVVIGKRGKATNTRKTGKRENGKTENEERETGNGERGTGNGEQKKGRMKRERE